jgi:predicted nucleic acid-binding protein
MRLVLDTVTVVAAIRSDAGASRWLLRAALERRRGLTLLVSVPLLIEYEAVMTRREHLDASGLSAADVGALLDAVAAVAEPVRLAYLWRPTLQDGDDDMVLEVAINGRADGVVTFNLRDFALPSKRFGISVLSPGQAMKRLEKKL